MKKIYFLVILISVGALSSCASIFCGTKAKITVDDPKHRQPVSIVTDCDSRKNVTLPCKVKVLRGFKPSVVRVTSEGYKTADIAVEKKFNAVTLVNVFTNGFGIAIDAATGAMMKPKQNTYYFSMVPDSNEPTPRSYVHAQPAPQPDPTIVKGEEKKAVSRDTPGQTALEQTIIRWYLDSDPRGARVFWRVISSVPAEVKNTNETYLMTTPYEETRSFNILGLTYENSRDVTIEIKITKRGYEDQVKRFNVRQAIDQQEISSFFELVPKVEPVAHVAPQAVH